jgi:hypothetical protein
MITPPGHQNPILLYIETELILTTLTSVLVSILKLLHSQLHPTPFPFISVFSAMSGISAVILGISITAAIQKRRSLILSFRPMFHLPFAVGIIYGASLAFRGPLAGIVFSSLRLH